MKKQAYFLLLLLLASCGSRQTLRHANVAADVQTPPVLPVEVREDPQEVREDPQEEPVVSARPLVSQVHQFPKGTWQREKQSALDSLCRSDIFETTQLGLYVYDLTDGEPLYAVGAAQRMRPASCQKILTAVTALHCLKGDYRLRTEFRTTGSVAGRVLKGDLIVVGGTDPLVTFDELVQAAASIRQSQAIDSIAGSIVYDLSMREEAPYGWGWCWDDDYGPLSALLVDGKDNFDEKWRDAMQRAGIRTSSPSSSTAKAAEGYIKKGNNTSLPSRREAGGRLVYSIRHDIDDLLVPMMKKSDNIFAECLFYQTAASTGKKRAGRSEAARLTEDVLRKAGVGQASCKVADGSGLSLYNYVTAEVLVGMLAYAWRSDEIRSHLLPSLPVAGYDGTLQKRMVGTEAEGNVRAKTGTVTGIVSLAGYLTTASGHVLAFAIINQGISASATGRTFQDSVCRELCR